MAPRPKSTSLSEGGGDGIEAVEEVRACPPPEVPVAVAHVAAETVTVAAPAHGYPVGVAVHDHTRVLNKPGFGFSLKALCRTIAGRVDDTIAGLVAEEQGSVQQHAAAFDRTFAV
jgi:hypothetical protein